MEINITLTKEQKKHLKSLQWLFMGQRASGRTTLLAYVLIETVLKTGREMRIFDHHPEVRADVYLANVIDLIIKENKLPLEVSRRSLILRLTK